MKVEDLKTIEQISKNLGKRLKGQPDSRCASDDEVTIAYLLSIIQDLTKDVVSKDVAAPCVTENQHGEPYCHTHQCSPSDPCIVQGCLHCVGDQGNDSLGLSKPDPAVVGGKSLPFKEDIHG